MGAVSSSGIPLGRGGRKKARKLLCLAVSAVALLTILAPMVTADDSSAEPDPEFTISLVDAKGNVITSPLFTDYKFQFSTETTPNGTRYILQAGVPIDSRPAYFVIRSDQDLEHNLFRVSVKMEGLAAWMDYYGIRACSDDNSIADLRKGNSYDAVFKENGKDKTFEFNRMYGISFATLDGSQSETVPSSMGDIRITLTAELIPGCHSIYFYSDHETGEPQVIEKRALYENEPLGPLPQLVYEGNTFEGWYDSEGKEVSETTLVSELPSDSLFAKWEWPLIEHWSENRDNPDGSKTLLEYTRWTYRDGSVKLKVVETTTYPDGNAKREESSESKDPTGETTESSSSSTDITKHEGGSETWNTNEKNNNSDGTSEEYRTVTEYDKEGNMVSENTEAKLTDAEKNTREYGVNAQLVDEKEKKYRVEAIVPETTILDVDNAKKLIDQYDYSVAVVGTHSDTGLIIVSDEVMTEVAKHGYYLSVSNTEQYVAIDDSVVRSLSDTGGEVRMQIKDASKDAMTDPQKNTVGDNYVFSVVLTVDGKEVSALDGYAEISVDPEIVKGKICLVNDDGSVVELEGKKDPITGKVTYATNHLSIFMVVGEEDDDEDTIFWALIGGTLAMFTIIPAAAILIYRRRRRHALLNM